jgi:ABC-2 type transport system permease protein
VRALLALAGKEARDILRERTILVSLVVQLFVAGFSTFLAVGLTGLYDPESVEAFPETDLAYAGPDDPGGFDSYLQQPNIRVQRMDAAQALAAFRAGRVGAVIEEVWDNTTGEGVRTVSLLVPDGTIQGTLLLTQVKGLLEDYEHDLRQDRQGRLGQLIIDAPDVRTGRGASYAFTYGTLLPLLVLTPIFLSGAIAGDSFVHEVQTRTLLLLRASPMSGASILAGKLLVPVLLAPAQVALWIGLLRLNHIPVPGLPLVLAITTLLALLMAGIGVALASLIRHEGQVQATYALIVLVVSVGSLALPHDPLNLLALAATQTLPPSGWLTLAVWGLAAVVSIAVGLPLAARRLRRDQV